MPSRRRTEGGGPTPFSKPSLPSEPSSGKVTCLMTSHLSGLRCQSDQNSLTVNFWAGTRLERWLRERAVFLYYVMCFWFLYSCLSAPLFSILYFFCRYATLRCCSKYLHNVHFDSNSYFTNACTYAATRQSNFTSEAVTNYNSLIWRLSVSLM